LNRSLVQSALESTVMKRLIAVGLAAATVLALSGTASAHDRYGRYRMRAEARREARLAMHEARRSLRDARHTFARAGWDARMRARHAMREARQAVRDAMRDARRAARDAYRRW